MINTTSHDQHMDRVLHWILCFRTNLALQPKILARQAILITKHEVYILQSLNSRFEYTRGPTP